VELLLEVFFELLLQLVAEFLIEAGFQAWSGPSRESRPILAFLGHAVLGAVLGWITLLVFPTLFIQSPMWQKVNLAVTPVLAGLTMSALGWVRRKQGKTLVRLDRFSYGFVFAFAMALVRYLGAAQ
jgi:hypothetical protein